MDQLHLIRVFVAVVDAHGLAAAARELNISPPAVTRAINELEAELGVRLLTRSTRTVHVTDAGAHYAEDCRRILTDLIEANESVGGKHSAPRGRLTVTAPALFGAKFVTPIVTEYLQCYQEVSVSCWFLDRVVNMIDEGVDIGVRIAHLPDSSMQAIQVGNVRRVICGAPSYLERCGIPQVPDDLHNHNIVSASAVAPFSEWRLIQNGAAHIVKLHPRLITNTNDSAIVAAVSGFGLTELLSYQVADHLRDGRLKIVLSNFEAAPLPVQLVHHEGRHASRKARAFLDLAIERLRANPAFN